MSDINQVTVPAGYNDRSRLVTWDEFIERHFNDSMEPEFNRRMQAAFWFANVHMGFKIGIGSGGPRANPHPISPASMRGQSLHQKQRYNPSYGLPGGWFWSAADLVVWVGEGKPNRAPTWDEVQFFELFCLHAFIGENTPEKDDDEPWHVQGDEQRGWAGWVNRGRLHLVPNKLFDDIVANIKPGVFPDGWTPGQPPTKPNPTPNPTPKPTMEVDVQVQEISKGSDDKKLSGSPVKMLQVQLSQFFGKNLKYDGKYGAKTEKAVEEVQEYFDLKVDGVCGPKTWDVVLNLPMSFID